MGCKDTCVFFKVQQRTVLVIAYHFPPGGGPGVQRVLKHVTYLRDAGWKPVVMTVANGDFPARDESLLAKIPADVPVHRVRIYEPYDLYRTIMGAKGAAIDVNVNKTSAQRSGWKEKLAEFIRATFFIPDARIGWMLTAVKAGVELCKRYHVDAVYSSSPPYTCALIGRAIKRRTGLPWVVGLRDPWTNFLTTPERWFLPAAIDRALERSVLTEADAVECAWQGIIDDARLKYPALPAAKFHHVPNGFDSADVPDVPYQRNDVFTVTYTGSMYGHRNPRKFLDALEQLHAEGVLAPDDVRLRFVGRFGEDVKAMLAMSRFATSVENIAYVPHAESVAYLMRSDVLLLIVDDTKESTEIVPGKVYEYLGVGRPILALAPRQSAIARLMHETNAGMVAPQEHVEAITEALRTFYARWKAGIDIATPNAAAVSAYERRASARKLAGILDACVDRVRGRHGV
jgi:glycosyltransferase involved in cell wall biosynthesis